jgi:hypothetical protein
MLISALSWIVVALIAAAPAQQTAQPAAPPAAQTSKPAPDPAALINPDELPVSIDAIQRAINHQPAIKVTEQRSIFRVEVFGNKPTIEDILGKDYLKGPTPTSPGGSVMTHQEFLNMVTPEEFRGYAPYTNKEGLQLAATSLATAIAMQAVQSAWKKYRTARQEAERDAARQEVEQALEALRKARRDAGLPDK